VFAALLAQSGFTGAEAPIEGKHGLWDVVGRFDWPLEPGIAPERITRTHLKCFPICYHGQSAVWAALGLRDRVAIDEVTGIRIETHRTAINLMANEPSRWAPATHETADHSLPYVVATALLDGAVDESSFTEAKLRSERVHALMSRTKVAEDVALTAAFPESSPCRVTVQLQDSTEVQNEVRYPKGHDRSPMSAVEVNGKFKALFAGYGSARQANGIIDIVDRLEALEDVGALFARFVRRPRRLKTRTRSNAHPAPPAARARAGRVRPEEWP
jgi:2-methylcitrate dehydratase